MPELGGVLARVHREQSIDATHIAGEHAVRALAAMVAVDRLRDGARTLPPLESVLSIASALKYANRLRFSVPVNESRAPTMNGATREG